MKKSIRYHVFIDNSEPVTNVLPTKKTIPTMDDMIDKVNTLFFECLFSIALKINTYKPTTHINKKEARPKFIAFNTNYLMLTIFINPITRTEFTKTQCCTCPKTKWCEHLTTC